MKQASPTPDPAATVIALRPSDESFEVLMVRRVDRGFFGGLVVFPGGGIDEVDRSELAQLVVPYRGEDHDFRSAALREFAEETGLLVVAGGVEAAPAVRGRALFEALRAGDISLDAQGLVLVSRWVTPESAPRRFDTMFYLLTLTGTPPIRLDEDELVEHCWVSADVALDRYERGGWPMFLPTVAHLKWLARRASIEEALDSAQGADGRSLVRPKRAEDGSLLPTLLPAESI